MSSIQAVVELSETCPYGSIRIAKGEKRLRADELGQVHVPDSVHTGGSISPEDIDFAVGVEISGTCNGPALIGNGKKVSSAEESRSVHIPDNIDTAGGIPPEDIDLAVVVEIVGPDNGPALIGYGRKLLGAEESRSVHIPDSIDTAGGIPPEDVDFAVGVEVTGPDNGPALIGDGREALGVEEDGPVVCAWYPSLRSVVLWNLSDSQQQLTVRLGDVRRAVSVDTLSTALLEDVG